MPSRYIRDAVILNKIETISGTDAAPTGALNAVAASNIRITPLNAQFVSRELLRGWFGASEELISSYNKLLSFDVEAVGSGTAGTAPAWAPLLRACGFAETLTATERATYKPITNGQETVTQYCYDSGILHKLLGAKGAVSIELGLGGIPKLKFAFVGIDGGDSAATPSGVTIAAYQPPQVVQDQFSGDLTLGATLSAPGAAPSLTGGTTYPSQGISIDMGIKAEYIGLLGSQSVEITDRKAKATVRVDATVAQEIAFYDDIKAGTLRSIALIHGSVAGRRFGIFAPNGQIIQPSKEEMSGKRLIGLAANLLPSAAGGNDDLTIVTSF